MSENPALEAHEHREHAEHAAEANNPLITRVSITIALLAVITAVIGSLESLGTAGAIIESNKATLAQGQASDQWAFYQSKSIKKRLDEMGAAQGGPNAEKLAQKAVQEGKEQAEIQAKAKAFEAKRDEAREAAELDEARHPRLTLAAALLQTAIAISTIAIITRRRWPWYAALLLGIAGVGVAASAFLA